MTWRTSAVAVCCSRASRVSVISRAFSIATEDGAITSIAEQSGGFRQGVEDRLEFVSRAADDLEHVASSSLEFQRLLQIGCALAQFAEEAGVLDRYHRLIRERRCKRDLFVSKPLDPRPAQNDDAELRIVPQQRHSQSRAQIAALLYLHVSIVGIARGILDMDSLAFKSHSSRERATIRDKRIGYHEIPEFWLDTEGRNQMVTVLLSSKNVTMIGLAEAGRGLDQHFEH